MNFEIEVAQMQRILNTLATSAKVNASDNTGRILVRVTDDMATFVANNNDTSVIANTDQVTVGDTGEMVFSFSDLRTFIPKIVAWNGEHGTKTFVFKTLKSGVFIYFDTILSTGKKSKGKIKLKEYTALGFPVPSQIADASFILNSNIVKPAINKVLYSINQKETRANLRGINVTFDENFIYFAGTNGKMLSEFRVKNVSDYKDGSFIFKFEFMSNLNKILGADTQVFFSIGEGRVMASFDDISIFGTLVIDKPYPNYLPVLNSFKETVSIGRESLFESLKPLAESLDPDDNYRLTVSIKDRSLFLSSEHAEFLCDDNVNYDSDFVIDVNGVYMLKTIDAIKDDILLIKFGDAKDNLVFDSGNFEDQKALITPIKRRTNE